MPNDRVEIIVEISPLERERWEFWFYETTFEFYVDLYVRETRSSKRHRKWSPISVDGCEQIYHRLGTAMRGQLAHPPDVPQAIADDAWQQYCSRIKFGGEYKR